MKKRYETSVETKATTDACIETRTVCIVHLPELFLEVIQRVVGSNRSNAAERLAQHCKDGRPGNSFCSAREFNVALWVRMTSYIDDE